MVGKELSIAAISEFLAHTRQQALCQSLVATQGMLLDMAQQLQQDNSAMLVRVTKGAARPWRDHTALDECTEAAHAAMQFGHTSALVRALIHRAKLFVVAHEYENAALDLSVVVSLCEDKTAKAHDLEDILDAGTTHEESQEPRASTGKKSHEQIFEGERDDIMDTALLRRGLVYRLQGQNELALKDLERAWARFRVKRSALGLHGVTLNPTPLLDRAAQVMHVLKFKVRMMSIGSEGEVRRVAKEERRRQALRPKTAAGQWEALKQAHEKEFGAARGVH